MKLIYHKYKCCLRGAYGPGNFGDDLLMLASYNILKDFYDLDELVITAKDSDGTNIMIPGANVVSPSSFVFAKTTFLGGGGQYFCFNEDIDNKRNTFWNKLKKVVDEAGFFDVLFSQVYRRLFKSRWRSKYNIGFCLGLGPFEKNNSKEECYFESELTGDVGAYLSVRDETSMRLASDFGVRSVHKFSDPIFNNKLWMPKEKVEKVLCKNSVSIIIRSWPFNSTVNSKISELRTLASFLIKRGYDVNFISLYESYDIDQINYFRQLGYDVTTWKPAVDSLHSFLETLCSSAYLVTTRAHGAIVPATLGIPAVIVNVEPKLSKVHSMLSGSSMLVDFEQLSSTEHLEIFWNNYIENYELLKANLSSDLNDNIESAIQAEISVREVLKRVEK